MTTGLAIQHWVSDLIRFYLSGNLTLFKNHEPDDGMVSVPFGGRIIPGHAKGSVTIFI